jgi:hypothetical protein
MDGPLKGAGMRFRWATWVLVVTAWAGVAAAQKGEKAEPREQKGEPCLAPLDDAYEQNDSFWAPRDLAMVPGPLPGVFETGVAPAVAIENDQDYYRFELPGWAEVGLCIHVDAPLHVRLIRVVNGVVVDAAIDQWVSTPGEHCFSTGMIPAAEYQVALVREAQCAWTHYKFQLKYALDPDDDGVPTAEDNCPDDFNPGQTDFDRDGRGDACDPFAAACNSGTGTTCRDTFTIQRGAGFFYWRSHDLGAANDAITRVVIVSHGRGTNPGSYFRRVVQAAENNGEHNNTLVIAPFFPESDTPATPSWHLRWDDDNWPHGHASTAPPFSLVSSFRVVDALIDSVTNGGNFANLNEVILTGHSAGGQLTQRYALGGEMHAMMPAGVALRYIISNPSSHTALDPLRWDGSAWGLPGGCPSFDVYPYGFALIPPFHYMLNRPPWVMVSDYLSKSVTYLAGSEEENCDCGASPICPCGNDAAGDNISSCNTDFAGNNVQTDMDGDGDLDPLNCSCGGALACTCDAQAQGPNRWDRLDALHRSVLRLDPTNTTHRWVEVPFFGHQGRQMYRCNGGPQAMFGSWARSDAGLCAP